ncbi:FAD-dependent oxidoreductase [Marinitenerispora sediminis]|uniref:ferredoxin--NADP(+) reductase n=1 Tax=Marinitenerispora sediminis TaxID=1931232 RepID=A0A368T9G7_9ACTN|nr:FAD-dependent oxidoreductase [Marinitenerispora sediminis]RCV52359.1 NADP oxidoreductase [Marinitenerispora sediminis]RCV60924.1 NADP oxidoreductase [Marinitenerispora sediminis]RCV62215.1 NADP oxidoreductase [Marinitenerispora sediminis]
MTTPDPLRVAVIGSGPAGIYTADALTRQNREAVAVDILDRLPTPYGLVRYGVAPDHTTIKGVARALRRVLEHPDVRFVGGVEFGRDVTRADLARAYDAVVYATGAAVDRRLGIPGEDLPGSVAATDFVNWYCGHPDAEVERFLLDAEEVAVIGVGNVALDVTRILAKSADELRGTDIPQPMLDVLAASKVRRIHLLGRRGPTQAKFTANELRDLGDLGNADVVVRPEQLDIDPSGEEMLHAARAARTNLKILKEWAAREPADRPRRVDVRFWVRPTAVLGEHSVSGLEVERTELAEDGRLVGTGERERLPVGMVLRSVGYASVPLPGVPFDAAGRTVPHAEGRVLDPGGGVRRGDYVAGWLKRGATGVIGTNKSDAAATVRALLDDAPELRARRGERVPVERVLAEAGARATDYRDWLAIDAAEAGRAADLGRGERVKLLGWDELFEAIGR